jgi:hypothetical protein
MLKMIFILIIIYIVLKETLDRNKDKKEKVEKIEKKEVKQITDPNTNYFMLDSKSDRKSNKLNQVNEGFTNRLNNNKNIENFSKNNNIEHFSKNNNKEHFTEDRVKEFNKPNPWTKLIVKKGDEYPLHFHIKIKIPSLNDFQTWKQIVPNLNFDPNTGEMIIPSQDEAAALALANLIIINFTGQMTLKDILEKNLIQISVAKAKSHELVQNKLREQIMDNLGNKQNVENFANFSQDLTKNNNTNFQTENFSDTFQHFDAAEKANNFETVEAFHGNDYSSF